MLHLSFEGFASSSQNHLGFIGFSCDSLHSNSQFTSQATPFTENLITHFIVLGGSVVFVLLSSGLTHLNGKKGPLL